MGWDGMGWDGIWGDVGVERMIDSNITLQDSIHTSANLIKRRRKITNNETSSTDWNWPLCFFGFGISPMRIRRETRETREKGIEGGGGGGGEGGGEGGEIEMNTFATDMIHSR
ncbi:hypothetical protein M0804_010053 [Polistes exclamans]|nr:hypothetical protein M0804_010053 [Polistes exclamans]